MPEEQRNLQRHPSSSDQLRYNDSRGIISSQSITTPMVNSRQLMDTHAQHRHVSQNMNYQHQMPHQQHRYHQSHYSQNQIPQVCVDVLI